MENQTHETPIKETERIQIIRYKTPFTYRSILKIYYVEESDAQDYICTGKCTNEMNHDVLDTTLSDYAIYKLITHGNYNIIDISLYI